MLTFQWGKKSISFGHGVNRNEVVESSLSSKNLSPRGLHTKSLQVRETETLTVLTLFFLTESQIIELFDNSIIQLADPIIQ